MKPNPLSQAQLDSILLRQGHEPCPGVDIEFNRPLGSLAGGPPIYATIYRPNSRPAQPMPGLLAFHGGGFIVGDPNGCGELAKTLALSLGITTVSASYRLATQNTPSFPAILDETTLAWRWVQQQALELNIDPTRISVSGESAGVLQAAHLAVNSPLQSLSEEENKPAALISLWGCFDYVARWFDRNESPGAEHELLGATYQQNPRLYHLASPVSYASGQLPPALFIYGSQDRVVHARQGEIAHAAWQAANAHSELKIFDNVGHDTVGDNRSQQAKVLQAATHFLAAQI
ncbi:alpha/beta hydrolase [Pelagicoccus sp. SDUM812002]|uniref:alpha/beta hydrolase n=1 Tax=Pelagicoccus sp. SDUM812002 TaxID=3041266 RepID=UPI00280D4B18|nr:alpha/beta hydrolase [Pelagicoccus sp. SDUM812002]MDQ8184651.1 alpha/beta hydrolase [Pelagicoccus sp. SDUM812002]